MNKPKVGVVSIDSLHSWVIDEIQNGIDLDWIEFEKTIDEQLEAGVLTENEAEKEKEYFDSSDSTILFGQWIEDEQGKYRPDPNGTFAAEYSRTWGNVCIDWSKFTKECGPTSPCYMMADGSGPCGDLDTEGDEVLAYTLPPEYFKGEENNNENI